MRIYFYPYIRYSTFETLIPQLPGFAILDSALETLCDFLFRKLSEIGL